MKKITPAMIRHWIGSEHMNTAELLELIAEVANGDYRIDDFRADVLDLAEGVE